MFLRLNRRTKDGKDHTYWSLVETVRTPDGPRQKTLCYLGELNSSAQARWLKTIEVFNEQGEAQQLKLFPAHVEPPRDYSTHEGKSDSYNPIRQAHCGSALEDAAVRRASAQRPAGSRDPRAIAI